MKSIFRNISYVVFSNLISFVSAAIVTFFAPKILGVKVYGYFQLYLLYTSYIGCLHFGWADGILLRYGGKYYNELDKKSFSGQFRIYFSMEILIAALILVVSILGPFNFDRKIILGCTCIALILGLPCTFLQYILQATNRMKNYALPLVIGRSFYIILACVTLLLHIDSYIFIISADLFGRFVTLTLTGIQCRDVIFAKAANLKSIFVEAKKNISAGSALVLASLTSTLIIGIVQFAIENKWGIETFGKVSLTISVSNILMVFIRAVALGIFPMLRRTNADKLVEIYENLRSFLMVILLGMLVIYLPVRTILSYWIPQYADSLKYMALLFPMCVFESKTSMLTETYIKTLRKEKWLLYVNITTVLLGAILTAGAVYIAQNLDLAVITILALLAFKGILSEILLTNLLQINVNKDIIYEIFLTIIFVFSSLAVGGVLGIVMYGFAYAMYLFIKRENLKELKFSILKRFSGWF